MLPLGGLWTGDCHAVPGQPWLPDDPALQSLCNLGYARGICQRFVPTADADAVRFAISRDDGATLSIYYVMERDHHPLAHGPLDYCRSRGVLLDGPEDSLVRRQALAYVESYLRRRPEPDAAR